MSMKGFCLKVNPTRTWDEWNFRTRYGINRHLKIWSANAEKLATLADLEQAYKYASRMFDFADVFTADRRLGKNSKRLIKACPLTKFINQMERLPIDQCELDEFKQTLKLAARDSNMERWLANLAKLPEAKERMERRSAELA